MRPALLLALLLAGCGEPGGQPLVSAQNPPAVNAANSQPQPLNSLPDGAGSTAPGTTHPSYLSLPLRL